ncbi:DUF3265 domain-containing protein [Photobacterium damselae subsp. damselae]|nr:DUF3265 domain-containing protein [Photobacterium damselae]PSB80839.1 DUF3265 domain-containing protein [Photobacterium damselae subsp. damselae]
MRNAWHFFYASCSVTKVVCRMIHSRNFGY